MDPADASHHRPGQAEPLIGPAAAPALHVMSWNIRRRADPPFLRTADRWEERAPRLQTLLEAEQPTLLGVQEALADQASFVQSALGEGYLSLGEGRGPRGGGEGNPILYDADRLKVLHWEQAALSTRPHKPGSRSWASIYPRIMVSAIFRDRLTGSQFLAINTHLDHLSPLARLMGARALSRSAQAASAPTLITGDFNARAGSRPLAELQSAGQMADAWTAAEHRLSREWDTYAHYRQPRATGRRVDWILTSPSFRVVDAAINTAHAAGGWASDHLPVQATVRLA
ncbi:endonuclease/exonuclease/phosphatase family protein [Nesterenkonia populi]|uniref:endonuclease/exonuclease/phosphatase family protein n=1 Tax=Nesterenkonia populi TaxID=1591087 RepID=UPI001B866079|nr:endonuclease/exonuclease/phosphatase family protein [Nesterenkonia populi]